jgi:hypothetical protein
MRDSLLVKREHFMHIKLKALRFVAICEQQQQLSLSLA